MGGTYSKIDAVQFQQAVQRAIDVGINLFRTLFGPDDFPRNVRAVEEVKALAAEYHKTLPQCALRWTLSHPVLSVALVGCRQAAEVEENLGVLGWAISEAAMAAIDASFARHSVVTMPPGWLEDDSRHERGGRRWLVVKTVGCSISPVEAHRNPPVDECEAMAWLGRRRARGAAPSARSGR